MFDERERRIVVDYQAQRPFSGSIPAITGPLGIPLWCYYVNRGQCIAGFGTKDRDHAIMEFVPARTACREIGRTGFRTFIKTESGFLEPFSALTPARLHIGPNELLLYQKNDACRLDIRVLYYILPGEEFGGLVRMVTVRNLARQERHFEILDGLGAIVPYGMPSALLKESGETARAFLEKKENGGPVPFFRFSRGKREEGAWNFALAFSEREEGLPVLTAPESLFGRDSSMETAWRFCGKALEDLLAERPFENNELPCCFFGRSAELPAGKEVEFYELYGCTENREAINRFFEEGRGKSYFGRKYGDSDRLAGMLAGKGGVRTGNGLFDFYCRRTFLDQMLSGGEPLLLGGRFFGLYTGVHSDMEQDAKAFHIASSEYSEEAGDAETVFYNRRGYVRLEPRIRDQVVKLFFNRMSMDGYAGKILDKTTCRIPGEEIGPALKLCGLEGQERVKSCVTKGFTPAVLYRELKRTASSGEECGGLLDTILAFAVPEPWIPADGEKRPASLRVGLELMEDFLSVYPDQERDLLFLDTTYTYRKIGPPDSGEPKDAGALKDGSGRVVCDALIDKLLALCTCKMAELDPYGMGLSIKAEEERGRPAALPGRIGSSVGAACELLRLVEFTLGVMERFRQSRLILEEAGFFMSRVCKIIRENWNGLEGHGPVPAFFQRLRDAGQAFREGIENGVSGKRMAFDAGPLIENLRLYRETLDNGIRKAMYYGEGICPACFSYEIYNREEAIREGFPPGSYKIRVLPHFLEGPAGFMQLNGRREEKKELYESVRESDLYDEAVKHYRVSAPLSAEGPGRLKNGIPGWSWREGVYRPVEYRYLSGLLKSGLYEVFLREFEDLVLEEAVCRPYHNSTFLVSSVYPEKELWGTGPGHGRNGCAAELFQILRTLMFGEKPFYMEEGQLRLSFAPLIPSCLIGEKTWVEAMFSGTTAVTYLLSDQEDYIPGNYRVEKIRVFGRASTREAFHSGLCGEEKSVIRGAVIGEKTAKEIRAGRAGRLEVKLSR